MIIKTNFDFNNEDLKYFKKESFERAKEINNSKENYLNHIMENSEKIEYKSFIQEIARFGGLISGVTREYKQFLILEIYHYLLSNNEDIFKKLSIRETRIFFKRAFQVAPSQKTLRQQKKQRREKEIYFLKDFDEKIKEEIENNESIKMLSKFYFQEMESFKRELKEIGKKTKSMQVELTKKLKKREKEKEE